MGRDLDIAAPIGDGAPGLQYRGTSLPVGMTVDCCREIAALFNERADSECPVTNREFAVAAYEVFRRHRS